MNTKRKVRTNRSEYEAGYAARVNGLPIPGTVSRQWSRGYQAAWLEGALGRRAASKEGTA